MSGTVYNVSTLEELTAALSQASGNDVIELAPGHYGDLNFGKLSYDSTVTVRSANPDDPAVFNTINVLEVTNLTFDSIFVDFVPDETTVEWSGAVKISLSSGITIENSVIEGGPSVRGVSPDAEPGTQWAEGILGEPIGRGVLLYESSDVVIQNNDISNFTKGIVVSGEDITIFQNEIHHLRSSPVTGSVTGGLTVEENYFHDFYPWKLGGHGDHGDYVHLWSTAGHSEPISDINIKNNLFTAGDGESLLGVFLEDGHGVSFTDVNIEGNVIHLADHQAMSLNNVQGGTISNNTLLLSGEDSSKAPGIGLHHGTRDLVISNNVLSRELYGSSMENPEAANIVTSGNLVVQYDLPEEENYIGNLFVQGADPNNPLAQLQAVPGEAADGVGSLLTQPNATPAALSASFQILSYGSGADQTLAFDASNTYGPGGQISLADATFIWDFGDGETAQGIKGTHTYEAPGKYDVTLTVVMKDDSAMTTAAAEIGITGEDVIRFNRETGVFEAQGYGLAEALEGSDSAAIKLSDGAFALDLGATGTALAIDNSQMSRFFGSDDFELSMTIQADQPGISIGEIARIHGNLVLSVQEDGTLYVQMYPDGGTAVHMMTTARINDGKAYDIKLHFNDADNKLDILIDGLLVQSAMVEGGVKDMQSWGLTFGNPWGGKNFDGKVTAFEIDAGATDYTVSKAAFDALSEDTPPPPAVEEPDAPEEMPDAPVDETSNSSGSDENSSDVDTAQLEQASPEQSTPTQDSVLPVLDDYIVAFTELAEYQLKSGAEVVTQGDDSHIKLSNSKDYVSLGRMHEFESTNELSFSVDFNKESADGGDMRLVWNHTHIGLATTEDGLQLYLGQKDNPFHKSIYIDDLGLDDTEMHQVRVIVNDTTDHVQVILDGDLVYDEIGERDIEVSQEGSNQWGWMIGTPWGHHFKGEIHDFRIEAEADFVTVDGDGLLIV